MSLNMCFWACAGDNFTNAMEKMQFYENRMCSAQHRCNFCKLHTSCTVHIIRQMHSNAVLQSNTTNVIVNLVTLPFALVSAIFIASDNFSTRAVLVEPKTKSAWRVWNSQMESNTIGDRNDDSIRAKYCNHYTVALKNKFNEKIDLPKRTKTH